MKIYFLDEKASTAEIVKAKLKLLTAFSKVKASIIAPKKSEEANVPTKSGKNFKYYYTTLAAVISAINAASEDQDLDFFQEPVTSENNVGVRTYLFNSLGAIMDCGVYGSPSQKRDAQGYGSALTYAKRYSLCAIFGIATEDDDGKSSTKVTFLRKSQLEAYTVPYMGTNANLMDLYQEALEGIPEAQEYFRKELYKTGENALQNAQAVNQVVQKFNLKAKKEFYKREKEQETKAPGENNKPVKEPSPTPQDTAEKQPVPQTIGLFDGL